MSTCYCAEYGYPHPFDRQFCGTHPASGPLLPTRPAASSTRTKSKEIDMFLLKPNPKHRPEDVVRVVDHYATQAGVEPTNADYARAGYWAAVGRTNDARVMAGSCLIGHEADPFGEPADADCRAALSRLRTTHAPEPYEYETDQTYCPASDRPTDQCDVCTALGCLPPGGSDA